MLPHPGSENSLWHMVGGGGLSREPKMGILLMKPTTTGKKPLEDGNTVRAWVRRKARQGEEEVEMARRGTCSKRHVFRNHDYTYTLIFRKKTNQRVAFIHMI
ncbi:hypothetical protein JZ751_008792 [Albula glossodonta]|uniref:Uncharacterized protein n=1 Tax=Albula glossodonta TaxID=121402 RepID=A0A8T2P7Y1_9TELE|nr:hypothetical protein JZ751_008792 [Albula glossodonta]